MHIDKGITHSDTPSIVEPPKPAPVPKTHTPKFTPYTGKIRKSGTGGIYQINDHLYEGRYTPTNAEGKRELHTVYAKTREEVESMLEKMIGEVRERIKGEKEGKNYTA